MGNITADTVAYREWGRVAALDRLLAAVRPAEISAPRPLSIRHAACLLTSSAYGKEDKVHIAPSRPDGHDRTSQAALGEYTSLL